MEGIKEKYQTHQDQDKIAKAGNNDSSSAWQLCQLVCGWEPETPTFHRWRMCLQGLQSWLGQNTTSCIPWVHVQIESSHHVLRAYSILTKEETKYKRCLLWIQITNHLICAITTFSISLKACLTFLLDLSSPFKSCLRRMIVSHHKHFIIPMYFHSIWCKRFREEHYKRKCSLASLDSWGCTRIGWTGHSLNSKRVPNADIDAQETCWARLDLNNSAVGL